MKRYLLPVERKKASVRKETDAVSVTKPKIVHENQNTLPPRLLSQPYHEVEVCRGKEVSEAKVTLGPFFDNRADVISEVPARERHVNIGIHLSANSKKNQTGCKAGDKCLFPHRKVNEQTNKKKAEKERLPKKEEKAMTRMLWPL